MGSELDYWKEWVKLKTPNRDGCITLRKRTKLQKEILELLPEPSKSKVLDVGSSPLSVVGNYPGLSLTLLDPLADKYKQLYPASIVIKGSAENIPFENNYFDLVFSSNALDHCQDPVKAIQEMIRVVKPGCWILFEVYRNEVINNNYEGPHQWNFQTNCGRLYLSDKNYNSVEVENQLKGISSFSVEERISIGCPTRNIPMLVVRIQKI
jgi:SAM-dependent methyltransferase